MRKDPGNPRKTDASSEDSMETTNSANHTVDLIGAVFRGVSIVGVFSLLCVSAYFALELFHTVGDLIRDPSTAKQSVTAIADIVSAERLTVRWDSESEPLELGNLIAFLLLLGCYTIWLSIPAKLISICGQILVGSLTRAANPKGRKASGRLAKEEAMAKFRI